ncbi:hypothetical protein Sjap_006826 [Stephania japonica]|uniref:Uncharacterized protein n=1 Tax=Stephania japonica TaxID=461633 RepID=A0AAP0K6K2_9MAGN
MEEARKKTKYCRVQRGDEEDDGVEECREADVADAVDEEDDEVEECSGCVDNWTGGGVFASMEEEDDEVKSAANAKPIGETF